MGVATDLDNLDVMKLARSIERACQEGLKWERRRLEWIREQQKQQVEADENRIA